jgi:hypothetical protein
MSSKTPDTDGTIQIESMQGVEVVAPPESEAAPRPSRATPPPLPAYASMPPRVSAPPAPPKSNVGRMVIYAAVAMLLGAGVLAIVMSVFGKRNAQPQPASSAHPAASVINMPTVEMQDEPANSGK